MFNKKIQKVIFQLLNLFLKVDDRKNFGKVTLTGAGTGKLKWFTLDVLESVEKADVLIYDNLINRKILKKKCWEKARKPQL